MMSGLHSHQASGAYPPSCSAPAAPARALVPSVREEQPAAAEQLRGGQPQLLQPGVSQLNERRHRLRNRFGRAAVAQKHIGQKRRHVRDRPDVCSADVMGVLRGHPAAAVTLCLVVGVAVPGAKCEGVPCRRERVVRGERCTCSQHRSQVAVSETVIAAPPLPVLGVSMGMDGEGMPVK